MVHLLNWEELGGITEPLQCFLHEVKGYSNVRVSSFMDGLGASYLKPEKPEKL